MRIWYNEITTKDGERLLLSDYQDGVEFSLKIPPYALWIDASK